MCVDCFCGPCIKCGSDVCFGNFGEECISDEETYYWIDQYQADAVFYTKGGKMPTKIDSQSGIFLETEKQKADKIEKELEKRRFQKVSSKHFDTFEEADEYRKDFLKKNPNVGKDDKRRCKVVRREDGFDFVMKARK
jgi:hypothetical protein